MEARREFGRDYPLAPGPGGSFPSDCSARRCGQIVGNFTATYSLADQVDLTSVSSVNDSSAKFMDNLNNSTEAPVIAATYQALDVLELAQEVRVSTKFDLPINFTIGGYYQYSDLGAYAATTCDNILTGSGTGTASGRLADIAGILSRGREIWVQVSYDLGR